ncbi:MAG: 16S rRNA (adenine(1518)-N(6)/adenine(1519)-N(6))-dimethyltransferase RsmA, partial [Thiobacillaceae bacterium]|nr:16S rRNA (adenine(1518)-N(6)/adenine(1519)-N(6))-dimethyltransferase RsmA [Thiobacillaceae bacterium]
MRGEGGVTGHRPRKALGQHFLHDPNVIARIVAAVDPQPEDLVVEIGPGLGALTQPLLARLRHLHVVEYDRQLAAHWRAQAQAGAPISVYEADALTFDFGALGTGLRVVGNLPYNISTPLLFHLARYAERLRDLHLMLQREVVERMAAAPATVAYGRLSVMIQAQFRVERLFTVAPGCFRPPPKVESAVVRLLPLPPAQRPCRNLTGLAELTRRAFGQRRKTLRNSLHGLLAADRLLALGIDPQ